MAYISFQPSDYFNTVLYTGNGSTQSITGVGFQPDWIWVKDRTNSYEHAIFDAVRGVTKRLSSNATTAEATEANGLTAFGTDGFSVGSTGNVNYNSYNFVSWNWRAGGGQGSSNTDGSINTTYTSANTTAGFSICKWTGTGSAGTIGHGLGAVPSMIIFKNLDGSSSRMWGVYHKGAYVSASDPNILYLNNTNAAADDTNVLGTSVTLSSSVFSVGDYAGTNYSGEDIIAYCFAEKKGFSKFGSYTGNGNADGAFIYTGFKPAFVIVKRSSDTGNWNMMDTTRSPFNVVGLAVSANTSNADDGGTFIDILSNGFKQRSTSSNRNASGSTYVYMAFAEAPLVGSNNIAATAR